MRDETIITDGQDDVLFITSNQFGAGRQNPRSTINILNTSNTRNTGRFISQCNDVELSRNGELTVVYNTSSLEIFTIFAINNNSSNITGYIQISPDAVHFNTLSDTLTTIEPDQMGVFVDTIFAKFTAIVLNGPPYGHVRLYIQGLLAC
jgi:hypothetical protein